MILNANSKIENNEPDVFLEPPTPNSILVSVAEHKMNKKNNNKRLFFSESLKLYVPTRRA